MDVVERIKSELGSSPVVLFMKGTPDFPQCGFSAQTVAALRALGAQFKHVNIFEEPELREALKRYSNWPTYPQLYVNGELVGGCDIALEMYKSGELQQAPGRGRRGDIAAPSAPAVSYSAGMSASGVSSAAGSAADRPASRIPAHAPRRPRSCRAGGCTPGRTGPRCARRRSGRVRTVRIPLESRHPDCLGQHGLAECRTGERRGVEAGERVEGVALHLGARHRGVEKAEVEGGVVPDQYRAAALVGAHRVADLAKDPLQRVALRQRRPQRVQGSMPVTDSAAGSSRAPANGCTW